MTEAAAQLGPAASRLMYRVFGLDVASELELPELVAGGEGGDVAVLAGPIDHRPAISANGVGFEVAPGGDMLFRYRDVATFAARGGRSIVVDADPSADERALRLYLTGPVLASILHQRGLLVLHASTLVVGGSAVGFLGAPQAGKSTTAAAVYARGHTVLSDDLLPIDCRLERPLAQPGFPQLKLWPEVLASLGENPDAAPPLRTGLEKRARTLADRFALRPFPLERLYVLEPGPRVDVVPAPPAAATVELVRHSYWGPELPLLGGSDRHLAQCAYVARSVPVRVLQRPPGLGALDAVVDAVERDVTGNEPAQYRANESVKEERQSPSGC